MARLRSVVQRAFPPSTHWGFCMAGTGEFAREAPYGTSHGHRPGVYVEANQAKMPKPPADWIGVKLYGQHGEPIGLAFVPPDHDDKLLLASAWGYFDARTSVSGADVSRPQLRLER